MQQNIKEALAAHVDLILEYGDPLPEEPMSLEEAKTFHSASVADDMMESPSKHGEDVPALSTIFETVEFAIDPSPVANERRKDIRIASGKTSARRLAGDALG